LEGRWINLAVAAQRRGSLDFSSVSRDNPESLLKESWILGDLERDNHARRAEFEATRVVALAPLQEPKHTDDRLNKLSALHQSSVIPWQSVYSNQNTKRQVDLTKPEEVESFYNAMTASVNRKPKKDEQVDG
jgi:hypothetical protein